MNNPSHAVCYSDGGARGNPGPAGIGAIVVVDGKVVAELKRYLGETTNNQAEYQALLMALEHAKSLGLQSVECRLDSELVANQLNLKYKVKNRDLAPWFTKIWNLRQHFKQVTFHHVSREHNHHADRLVNEAIDEGVGLRPAVKEVG